MHPVKINVVQQKSLSLSSLLSHFPHHSQAADERCKEARSQPFHSGCKEAAWKLRQGSDPANRSSTSIQQVSFLSIRRDLISGICSQISFRLSRQAGAVPLSEKGAVLPEN